MLLLYARGCPARPPLRSRCGTGQDGRTSSSVNEFWGHKRDTPMERNRHSSFQLNRFSIAAKAQHPPVNRRSVIANGYWGPGPHSLP